jgi:DNA ligase 1
MSHDIETKVRPMLAATLKNLADIHFPVYASPKLDGVRALILSTELRSRSGKPFGNLFTQLAWSNADYEGFDGEFIFGPANSPSVFRNTNQVLSTIQGQPLVVLHVFDLVEPELSFKARTIKLEERIARLNRPYVQMVPQTLLSNEKELDDYEQFIVEQGYEGVMVRSPESGYKFGRSTLNQGWLLKIKRFEDSEAEVIGMEEKQHNENEAKLSPLGFTTRTSHKANQVGTGTMGALVVKDVKSGVVFKIGTGFSDADRDWFWAHKEVKALIVKYKFQPVGVKDKPRSPVFIGLRSSFDLEK